MIHSTRRALTLAMAITIACAACGSPLSPSQEAELAAANSLTDTFSGTVGVAGQVTHPFVVRGGGAVSLTLTAIGPNSTTLISLGLGGWNGVTCAIQLSTPQARLSEVYQASVGSAGNYCLVVADTGTFTGDVTYAVQVVHP